MPRIDVEAAEEVRGTLYPSPYDEPCLARVRRRLGDAAGLTQFGVNRLVLPPGTWSSQRHWHSAEDEFVWVVAGEVVLVDDGGEAVLRAGDCAGFKAGDRNGHQLQNRSTAEAVVLEVGSRRPEADSTTYPDIDLRIDPGGGYLHRDGSPYPETPRRGA